jgi:hypothetical protein
MEHDASGIAPETLAMLDSAPGNTLFAELHAALPPSGVLPVHALARLRKTWPPALVHAAIAVTICRRKAFGPHGKFNDSSLMPETFWAVPEALEQASGWAVARHKAMRFAALAATNARAVIFADLCCGIGGDTLALASEAPVVAVDLSAARAWCASRNLARTQFPVAVLQADVEALPLRLQSVAAFHIDPARRSAGRRSAAWANMIPGPHAIEALLAHCPNAAIKLSSAVEFNELPPGHIEIISERRTAVQAVLWTGAFAENLGPGGRTATVLDAAGGVFSISGRPQGEASLPGGLAVSVSSREPLRYLYVLDPAVHRAGFAAQLAAEIGCYPVNDDGGYLTSSTEIRHLALTVFLVEQELAWSERKVAAALTARSETKSDSGQKGMLEVKTRGGLGLDTDALQKRFQSCTRRAGVVFIYRRANKTYACIARRAISPLVG